MWILAIAITVPIVFAVLLILVARKCCSSKRRDDQKLNTETTMQSGLGKLHLAYDQKNNGGSVHHNDHDIDSMKRMNYYVLRRELSMKPYFNWADHPSLVSEAVEHGWPRFGFNGHNLSSPSTRSVLLGLCVTGDQARESKADVSWEIWTGSAEFMQKVRMNSGLKRAHFDHASSPLSSSCSTQTALPLPGPFLGNSSFPQEAYFEITMLSNRDRVRERKGEGDKIKLIQETANAMDELKLTVDDDHVNEVVAVSMGLSIAGSHPRRIPGSYPGSVGFNSDGSVYLDGIKLVSETPKAEWESIDRVIGCGFDPTQKKVFFTVDSELVHVINCKSEEFGRPLYPTLAANIDVTVLVNFGQSSFMYAPANVHRTPNPCFMSSLGNGSAAALGYEDSKELFSMGRIDAEWLNRCTTKSSHSTKVEIDEESETDLFEIVLDNMRKSPSTYL